jgi:hypothetical protein
MDHDPSSAEGGVVVPWHTPLQLTPACWKLASLLIDQERPGDFNQVMMHQYANTHIYMYIYICMFLAFSYYYIHVSQCAFDLLSAVCKKEKANKHDSFT